MAAKGSYVAVVAKDELHLHDVCGPICKCGAPVLVRDAFRTCSAEMQRHSEILAALALPPVGEWAPDVGGV